MPEYKRLPRKLKKQLKKNPEEWIAYLEERAAARERSRNLDIIFTRNYENGSRTFRKMVKTGKLGKL